MSSDNVYGDGGENDNDDDDEDHRNTRRMANISTAAANGTMMKRSNRKTESAGKD